MKRNKWLICLIAVVLVSGGLLCKAPEARGAAMVEVRVDGGPPGGGKNFRNEAVGEAIRRGNPSWDVTVITGPVSSVILGMMKRNELEVTTQPIYSVIELKKGEFGGKKLAMGPIDLRWIFASNYYLVGFYVLAKVPADSIDQLLAKKYPIKISVGQPGSGPYNMANLVLNAFGVTFNDLKAWGGKIHLQPSGRSIKLVRDGRIEGKFHVGTVPEPAWEDLSRTRDLKLLTLKSENAIKKLEKLGFERKIIPAGSYKFTPEDVQTLGMPNLLLVPAWMSDDIAYHIARSMWEQRDFLKSMHPVFQRNLNKKVIAEIYKQFGDLAHPGAIKYWKELGIIK